MIKKILFAATAYLLTVGFSFAGCLTYAGDGWFTNNCGYKLIFEFRTDGGCFDNGNGSETVGPYDSVKTAIHFECGGSYPTWFYWSSCEYDAWVRSDCYLDA